MRFPRIKGLIRRRLIVNFRARPDVVGKLLPEGLRPKLKDGNAIVGICLTRLEQLRPPGVPGMLGLSSQSASHRYAVQWRAQDGTPREGAYIARADTDSFMGRLASGRLLPGRHHAARFEVIEDALSLSLSMHSRDTKVTLRVAGRDAARLPAASCFGTLEEASAFFEGARVDVSTAEDGLEGLVCETEGWHVKPFEVSEVDSSHYMRNPQFPDGSVEFDHALVMRDVILEWRSAEESDMARGPVEAIAVPVMPTSASLRGSQ